MVKSGGGIYLFCGRDTFSREEAQKRLLASILPSGPSELNYDIYDAKDNPQDIFNTLNTLPFLSDRRVVVIKNVEHLPEFKKDSLLTYLQNPREHICLILQSSQGTLENKFIKVVSGHAKTSVFKRPRPAEVKGWVHNRLRGYKKSITKDALDLLLELKGRGDLAVLSGELEKLALYKGEDKIIKSQDVARLVGKSAVKRAFDLADAVSSKDRDAALRLVGELLSGSKRAIPEMMGLLGWQLRRIWKAKVLLSKKKDKYSVCSELNIRAFSTDRFLRQVGRFRADELKRDFKLLVEADRNIKRGRNRPEFVLEELVMKLCG